MTVHTDQAEMLIDELESLRQLLDKPLSDNIPVLDDQIPTLQPLSNAPSTSTVEAPSDLDAPLNAEQINEMVDDIVAEYMPVLEQQLRKKLLEALSFDI